MASDTDILDKIRGAPDLGELDRLRVSVLGKSGTITARLKSLGSMDAETRAAEAPKIHAHREEVTAAIAGRKAELESAELDRKLATETIDLSLPAPERRSGTVHPVSQVMDELAEIFADLGFAVAEGPEIEDQWHNFTALNMPEFHPARAMQDTFYLEPHGDEQPKVLRTHTSPVQIRAMQEHGAPLYVIAPGRVYRSDSDATHTPMFHQVEGIVIDRAITLGHLKWTLETFLKAFFERDDVVLRMRPSYFPFTEPSAEVDVGYTLENGKRVIGGSEGFMEVLGSGMVHPRVIAAAGLDPDDWQGFAFGCGIDRLAMLKYGMDDLRAFFDGDIRWLKQHLDTDADPSTIADALTAVGLEVEEVVNPAEALAPFRVAKVLTAERHPQADKLQVLNVDAGTGEVIQVVCGAPNARAGMLGVFGGPGTYVPGSDLTLKVAAIRGVESHGMMCSVRELQLGEEHDGIIELPEDAPVGAIFPDYAGLNDPVFDVNVTPNRPDCMGVDGIARDLAAVGMGYFKPADSPVVEGSFEPQPKVIVEPDSGCTVFWRRVVRGIRNGQSPQWLQQRLKAVGLRPISALVDITNYFSIDQARPLHVYDIAKLTGHITVRRGRKGEKFLALNGKEYEPTTEDCVIADESGAIGFGGVIGGESTGVDENTTDVLLECAWFDPVRIAATGQRHAVSTDARSRFERGIDPMKLSTGIESATQMILDLCGGEASEPRISGEFPKDGYPNFDRIFAYRPARLAALAGVDLPAGKQRAILGRLEFLSLDPNDPDSWVNETQRTEALQTLGAAKAETWFVRAPTWRPDVDGEADIVEEIARINGYDKVPSTPLPRQPGVAKPTATRSQMIERNVRRAAASRGLDEAVTWSFISEREADAFGGGAWPLANPISEEMKVMRPSLLPGLIAAASRNIAHGASSVRLFEIGRRYLLDEERPTATVLLAGEKQPRSWQSGKAQTFEALDAKAEALALLETAGAPVANLQLFPDAGANWHPGRSATLRLGPKTILASFGELHPRLSRELDAPERAVAAEIYLDAIPASRSSGHARPHYTPPALQPVTRDFAFIVPSNLPADNLVRAIRGADKQWIIAARLFDRFELADGLSLAVEVTLQPAEKSFTEAELAEISKRIVAAAEKLGARLRS